MSSATALILIGITCLMCLCTLVYAIFAYEYWGLGLTESISFVFNGKIFDHHVKCKVKPGTMVLLKTKYGAYPTRVTANHKFSKVMLVEPDPWLSWVQWHYNDIELLDTDTKRILYGD